MYVTSEECVIHSNMATLVYAACFLPDPKMASQCVSFTLPQQFASKYREPGNETSGEDLFRTCELFSVSTSLYLTELKLLWSTYPAGVKCLHLLNIFVFYIFS